MAFDPKAFLQTYGTAPSQPPATPPAAPGSAPFDPQAFLAQTAPAAPPEDISKIASFGRGVLQGGTLGFADEISGGIESLFTDKPYAQARDESRANFQAAAAANPITSKIGEIGGSVATALLPIPGMQMASVAGKTGLAGSRLAQGALLGAKLGAVEGVGHSVADNVLDMGTDAAKGAATGAVMSGITDVGIRGVRAGYGFIADSAHEAFDPISQRLLAIGANKSSLKKVGGVDAIAPAVETAEKVGIFSALENGAAPGVRDMNERVMQVMDDRAFKMHRLIEGQPVPKVENGAFFPMLQGFYDILPKASPLDRTRGGEVIKSFEQELRETGGDITKLWDLKKRVGERVNWAMSPLNKAPPLDTQLIKDFNGGLGAIISNHVDNVAKQLGIDDLPQLNSDYSQMSKLHSFLSNAVEAEAVGGGSLQPRTSDYVRGASLGGGVAALTGATGVGAAAGMATMAAGAVARSTSGRLARAKVGEMLNLGQAGKAAKMASDQAAQMQGMIPRTIEGVRNFFTQNAELVNSIPGMQAVVKNIMTMPDAAAEVQIRALMPMFDAYVAPSPYKSEFNGKITSPQDRVTARQIIMAQGLPPSVAAFHTHALNKSGTLQSYHYAKPAEDYGDEILTFNERLTQMGY